MCYKCNEGGVVETIEGMDNDIDFRVTCDDNSIHGGDYQQSLFEDEEDFYIGLESGLMGEVSPICIERDDMFRHLLLAGATGMGKSTVMRNLAIQAAHNDSGVCYIDHQGDELPKILERLPEDRLEDVVIVETQHVLSLGGVVAEPFLERDLNDTDIILVDASHAPHDQRKETVSAIMGKVWSHARRRGDGKDDPHPFHLFLDGAEHLLTPHSNIDEVLSMARSLRLSVTIGTMSLYELVSDGNGSDETSLDWEDVVMPEILGNIDSMLAFSTAGEADQELFAKKLCGPDTTRLPTGVVDVDRRRFRPDDFADLGKFTAVAQYTEDGEKVAPRVVELFPPSQPVRDDPNDE